MAKTSKSSIENAITTFTSVMQRASISDYPYVNHNIIYKNDKNQTIIISVDNDLWVNMIDNPSIKNEFHEYTMENNGLDIFKYISNLNTDEWIDIDMDAFINGKLVQISIEKLEYDIVINKSVLPIKLKKAEYNNIKYKIYPDDMVLVITKRFEYPIENMGFNMTRIFKII